ncbi:hypothetical protein H0H92_007331, partial [Tricholoma furcatifolium]
MSFPARLEYKDTLPLATAGERIIADNIHDSVAGEGHLNISAPPLAIPTETEDEDVQRSQKGNDDAPMTLALPDGMTLSQEDCVPEGPVAQVLHLIQRFGESEDGRAHLDDDSMTLDQKMDFEIESRTVETPSLAAGDGVLRSREATLVRKPRKRPRKNSYDAHDPRRFLDMEAEVSNDEESDEDGNGGLEDFINDASSESGDETSLVIPDSKPFKPFDDIEGGIDPREDKWGSEEELLDWDNDPAIASHDEVFQLMSTEEANYAWLSYLEEERRKREREEQNRERYPYDRHWYPDPVPETVPQDLIPDSIVPLIPRPSHDKNLWRVAVKRGQEEALAFILFSKAMQGNLI